MSASTREKLLAIAREQFAARGFDGVSLANIADRLGLSKQALLHHFSSKEQLYGEVLEAISEEFEDRLRHLDKTDTDPMSFAGLLLSLAEDARRHRPQTVLLMRELLDNSERARTAGRWFLRPFLDGLIERLQILPAWRTSTRAEALAAIYQMLGAINYFAVSRATLQAMFGKPVYAETEAVFDAQLGVAIHAVLDNGPARSAVRHSA